MDGSTLILLGFVILITGISKSAFAGALGVFLVPLLMLKLPAVQAISLMLPILIVADMMSLKSYWKKWDTKLLYSLLPGAAVGLILAHWTVEMVSTEVLKMMIAAFCIVFALRSLLFSSTKDLPLNNKAGALSMSALSGFSSTIIHAGGPPLIMYLTSLELPKQRFVATASVFFASLNVMKLIGFSSLGLFGIEQLTIALLFVPIAYIGNLWGIKLLHTMNVKRFLHVMHWLLLMLGCWLLWN